MSNLVGRPEARFVHPGEMLAFDPSKLHSGPKGFFWMFGGGIKPSERRGSVAIVHVRDGLEHHSDPYGADSYESIIRRVADEMSGDAESKRHKQKQDIHRWEHSYEDGYEPLPDIDITPPSSVLLSIDSPGGVVAGLYETCAKLRDMSKASGIRLVAFANEMAASAAYAIACACSEIVCPRSAIIGSVGVISTMISQAAKDREDGYDVRFITSGARKADGHPHAPISDAALDAKRDRVMKLAGDFWRMVSKARKVPLDRIQGLEAAIFLGRDAKRRGLVDEVMTLDDTVAGLQEEASRGSRNAGKVHVNEGNTAAAKNCVDYTRNSASPNAMAIKLDALVKRTSEALRTETDPGKYADLAMKLATYTQAAKDCDDDDEGGDEDEKASKAALAKKSEEDAQKAAKIAAKQAAKPKGEDDGEEDEAKAALALVRSQTGMTGKEALGAASALFSTARENTARIAALEQTSVESRRTSLIRENAGKYITKSECEWLATQDIGIVAGFVKMRHKAGVIVHTDDSTIVKPKQVAPDSEDALPEAVRSMIDHAVNTAPVADKKAFRATLVANHLKAHHDALRHAANGAGRI